MKIPYEGELYLKFDKGYPWYTMKRDYCIKVLFRIGKFYLSLRCKNITGYKPWIKAKLLKTFDSLDTDLTANKGKFKYYLYDMRWILDSKYNWKTTECLNVMYNTTLGKYVGYSHRGAVSFGIGDRIFDPYEKYNAFKRSSKENIKYCLKYIKCILKYLINQDSYMLEECLEEGINYIVPFTKRGNDIITTDREALESAKSLANYIS